MSHIAAPKSDAILVLNAGSSSLKFALYQGDGVLTARGSIERIHDAPHLCAKSRQGAIIAEQRWPAGRNWTHEDFLGGLLEWTETYLDGGRLAAVGHRVVHGGVEFSAPCQVDDAILARLDRLCGLAPLHQPHNLAAIRAIAALRGALPQIACFDTAFHHAMPAVATRFALPRRLHDQGIRRYGFHGLSYEFISRKLGDLAPELALGRIVAAHLGAGASLCAMRDGTSIDSSMGFTALDGLIMGTRCGRLDPGVLLHLMQQQNMTAAEIQDLLYHQSGLLGLSGLSDDMRELLASDSDAARQAIESFVYRIACEIGGLASALGGIDGVVFTAGIGENAPEIRAAIAEKLRWLGAEIDPSANRAGIGRISSATSAVELWVIPTDEERMIAQHVQELLAETTEIGREG